jgi:alpha-amylase
MSESAIASMHEQEKIDSPGFLHTYPSPGEVIKKVDGDHVVLRCALHPSVLDVADPLIVEAWTNLSGRYHGHEMKREGEGNVFVLSIPLKRTGFYNVNFRYRYEHRAYWSWLIAPSIQSEQDVYDLMYGDEHKSVYLAGHQGLSRKSAQEESERVDSERKDSKRKEGAWHSEESAHAVKPGEIHVDPAYIQKSIVYNAFIRFFGQKALRKHHLIKYGDAGTFDDLKHRLDEIKAMGVDVLYLNPIHPIGELLRNYNPHDEYPAYLQPGCPYSIRDYKAIDPETGADTDHSQNPHMSLSDPMIEFRELVAEAHKRKIKVFMDLVFNHTSHDFVLQRLHPEWFLYKENIKSLDDPYLTEDDLKDKKPWGDPAHTLCPFDHGYWWEDAAQLNWEYKLPDSSLPDAHGSTSPPKNSSIREMWMYFKSIPKFWITHIGIDGFRCDVAYRIPPQFWRECIHEARETARIAHPRNGSLIGDVVFVAESYCDDMSELFRAGFSAVYGDFSNKLYTPQTLKGYLDYMYNLSGNHFPHHAHFFIFPECHDFIRNPKKLLGSLAHDAVLSERANQSRWVLTATLPGIPMIFNGFEKLEWHPVNLFSYSAIDWERDKDLKKFITKVNKIRSAHTAFQRGTYHVVETNQGFDEHAQVFSYLRNDRSDHFLVCVNMDINNRAGVVTAYLDQACDQETGIDFSGAYKLHDLLHSKTYDRNGRELHIILEPGDSHIFRIEQSDRDLPEISEQK